MALRSVETALSITPGVLTDGETARRLARCVDGTEVQIIREALSRYPFLSARTGPAPTLGHVVRQLRYVDQAWLSSHFTVVVRHLPALLHDAQEVSLLSARSDQVAASRALVMSYRLASSVLLKFGTNDVAWLAADRAMQTALAVDDTFALARATRSVARSLTSAGHLTSAITALTEMAERMRPELAQRADELLSMYGMLYLAASIAAARQDDADTALLMHEYAEAAAQQLAPGYQTHHTVFGTVNVALHRVSALVRLHEPGRALAHARTINPQFLAALPAERRCTYMLDIAAAHTGIGRYNDAARSLIAAEHIAPEEVRCRPVAHVLLRAMVDNTSGELGRTVQEIAAQAGVTA